MKTKHRLTAALLSFCIILSMLNGIPALATNTKAAGTDDPGICEHHPKHDEECGYAAPSEGTPCTHEHTEDCYAPNESSSHVHDESCYTLTCGLEEHEHTGECYAPSAGEGSGEEQDGQETEQPEGTEQTADEIPADTEEDSLEVQILSYQADESACGLEEHVHDENCYTLTCGLDETGSVEDENRGPDACAHVHNEDCGYVEASEGHPCEFVCEICSRIVTKWTWYDQKTLEPGRNYGLDSTDWVLAVDGNDIDDGELTAFLPTAVSAVMKDGSETALDITWAVTGEKQTKYTRYTAALPEGYTLGEGVPELAALVPKASATAASYTSPSEPVAAASVADGKIHVIIRFWHAADDGSGNLTKSGSRYYEDYDKYHDPEDFPLTIKAQDPIKGADGNDAEKFTTFSISAGHNAVEYASDGTSVTIEYHPDIHLVKGHAFYISVEKAVTGLDSETKKVSGSTRSDIFTPDQDTAYLYVYANDGGGHQKGEVVVEGGKVFGPGDTPPDGIQAELAKVYNTSAGLHTDKTATVADDDGRTFDLSLEAWHTAGKIPMVGMILDASGSMAFSAVTPKPININDSDAGLTKRQADRLKSKQLKGTSGVPASEKDWERFFLTAEELSWLMDPRNTDNNPLSTSGYNYYVYDPDSSTQEYAPLGYWDGGGSPLYSQVIGKYLFTKGSYLDTMRRDWLKNDVTGKFASKLTEQSDFVDGFTFALQDADVITGWPAAHNDLKLSENGMNVAHMPNKEKTGFDRPVGIVLDARPSSENFTISFKLNIGSEADLTNLAEMLYIGPMEGSVAGGGYYRAYFENNSVKGGTGGGSLDNSALLTDIAVQSGKVITLVFSGGTVASYLDGGLVSESANTVQFDPEHIHIILDGIADKNNGGEINVDDIYVFNAALTSEEVWTLVKNPSKVTNVIDASGNRLAQWRGITELTPGVNYAGWYYVSHKGDLSNDIAKVMAGVRDASKYSNGKYEDNAQENLPRDQEGLIDSTDTGLEYKQTVDSTSIRFYIDVGGYLRCFYDRGSDKDSWFSSYVFQTSDSDYIKVEALQHALGLFVTQLNEVYSTAMVSAVRFSSNNITGNKLVLLDWTNDPCESAGILSLTRGKDGVNGYDPSPRGLQQYNYVLTGSTNTAHGLSAFNDLLSGADNVDKNAEKYLIIFTDGVNTGDVEKAQNLAEELREKGYTIFTVLLNGGPVVKGGTKYKEAEDFLIPLASRPEYFFSVDEEGGSADMDNVDKLTQIFSEGILSKIKSELESYSVKDYIDPRFDLVAGTSSSSDIYTIHLNAGGSVTVADEDGKTVRADTLDKTSGLPLYFPKGNGEKARNAVLYYDGRGSTKASEGLYYLQWEDQTIPGCAVGQESIQVWDAVVTVRAKDDFIGGNAILTNGNEELMNYVYPSNGQSDISSGTGSAKAEYNGNTITKYPSKGFPRTVVNVKSPAQLTNGGQTVFMGETLNGEEIKGNLFDAAKGVDALALEYLTRYNAKLRDELITEGKLDDIPYYYLPNADGSNHTGTGLHRADLAGYLNYRFEGDDYSNGPTTDTNDKSTGLKVTFTPLPISDEPVQAQLLSLNEHDSELPESHDTKLPANRIEANGRLVKDEHYQWDRDYKEDVGTAGTNNGNGEYTTNIVSGEIRMQLDLGNFAAKLAGANLSYKADMLRDGETVGTFELETIIDGAQYYDAKFTPAPGNEYMASYGLPLGIYTVANENGSVSENGYLVGTAAAQSSLSGVTFGDGINTDDYAAYADTEANQIILGYKGGEKAYTDYRFGLFRVPVAPPGQLEVTKAVTGAAGDKSQKFGFTVTIGGETYTFKLADGETWKSDEFAEGTAYTVVETDANVDGYETTVPDNASGVIKADTVVTVAFGNHRDPGKGSLTVTKTVTGAAGDKSQKFHFTVTIGDEAYTFELADGESRTFGPVPRGTEYTVVETDANVDGYETTVPDNSTGVIVENQTAIVEFVNSKGTEKGSLRVTKEVTGTTGETDREFHFTMTIGGITETFTLKDGEEKVFENLPVGTEYAVVETDANTDGYVTTVLGNDSGTIVDGQATVAFVNSRGAEYGNLTVTKTVAGSGASTTKAFTFTVALSGTYTGKDGGQHDASEINGAYGSMTFTNGAATFTLKHGESVSALLLPAGISYVVTESDNAGYVVSSDGAVGTISKDANAVAAFTNTKNDGGGTTGGGTPGTPETPARSESIPAGDTPLSNLTRDDVREIFSSAPSLEDDLLDMFSLPPLSDMTLEELIELTNEVPLSDLTEEELLEILDDLVPLSNVPKTGDHSWVWGICALVSGAGLVWLISKKKKSEDTAE